MIEIIQESVASLADYARISIAFEVHRVLDVNNAASGGGFILEERRIHPPGMKDYDAIEGEGPATWANRFDLSNWGFFAARLAGRRVGGAVVARDTPGVDMLEGRSDLAVLWDIRVAPADRGHGVGAALFQAAEAWAALHGCLHLKIETQNVNVPACRFYASQRCVLTVVQPDAYPDFPDEVQLIWFKDLG